MTPTQAQIIYTNWWKAIWPNRPIVMQSTAITTWMLQAAAPILEAGFRPISGEPAADDWIVAQELINWEEMPYSRRDRTPESADLIYEEDGHDQPELIFLAKLVANAGAVEPAKRRAALASAHFRVGRWEQGMALMGGVPVAPVQTVPDVLTGGGFTWRRV
ncbi:MAG: hypothetical protein M0R03_10220 [Novosphingobium sp.]|nr:hypothetical protein [Novosphingobium sp.]